MEAIEKGMNWRIVYGVFCLIYAVCIVYLGLDNFDLVHSGYSQAVKRLQPSQIKAITLLELTDECRAKLKRRGRRITANSISGAADETCQSFPAAVIKDRQVIVTKQLQVEKKRFKRKLIVFYLSFSVFFLTLPLYLLYLLISLFIWIFKDIKVSK